MNQSEFLQRLQAGLRGLPAAEIEDILSDYREYFQDALAAGRSEADTAAALGEPEQLARELRARRSVKDWQAQRSFRTAWRAFVDASGLGRLNVLLALVRVAWLAILAYLTALAAGLTLAGVALLLLGGIATFGGYDTESLIARWADGGGHRGVVHLDDGEGGTVSVQPGPDGRANVLIRSHEGEVRLEAGAASGARDLTVTDGHGNVRVQGLRLTPYPLLFVGGFALVLGIGGLWLGIRLLRQSARALMTQLGDAASASASAPPQDHVPA
ncbi:hypothetical protein GCM10007860_00570 [Chitiniphilus shinanonensis]|uniref:DUF1700 domain-containing protein n=1 Tax=Chitiniphilus shinanonensis TaxID=553088 RepID=A0ABQ6BN84_9NEIS|nr:DUF1700 domain-containing protein [Chitiniphilus shinanonensis]GLS02914.1 hypothetical protein GCM10007860_00570 [Chitiniphilus shinanonensis]